MKNIKLLVVVILAIIAIGVVWWMARHRFSDDSIRVGFIGPLTGSAASYGEEARNAVLLAEKEINENGGINGKKLQFIVEDGKCDGASAVNAYRKLIDYDDVKVILGGHCSTETLALAPLAGQNGTLLLADITSASVIPNEGEWVFRNSPPSSYYAEEAGKAIYAKGYKKVLVFTEQSDFPVDYSDNFEKSYIKSGGVLVDEVKFSPGSYDFQTILAKIKNKTFDLALISTQGAPTMGIIVKQMRETGIIKPVSFSASFNARTFLSATGGYMPPENYSVVPYLNSNSVLTKKFFSDYESLYGPITFTPYYIAATYDMAYRLKDALVECGQDMVCARNKFKTQETWTGAAGKIQFGADHRPTSPLAILRVVAGKSEYEPLDTGKGN